MSDPAMSPKKPSLLICLVVGLGVLLAVAVGAGLLLPAIANAKSRARVTSCASNLRMIWTLQMTYQAQFGGPEKLMPVETGSAFWLKLTRTTPSLVDPSEMEIFLCPVHDKSTIGACDYLGPSRPVKTLPGGDPVGADRKGNHREGGNILRKSGDVLELQDADFSSVCDRLSP